MAIPPGIEREHVEAAIRAIDQGEGAAFGTPTRYVLRYGGREYAPKAVIGVAARAVLGRALEPTEFSSGIAPGQAVHLLRQLGFDVDERAEGPHTTSSGSAWAILCNPQVYDIERASQELDEDAWTLATGTPEPGDRLVLWKTKGRSSTRGVVALGEVLAAPEVIPPPPESLPFWISEPGDEPKRRIRFRYIRASGVPLWISDDRSGLLESLTVSRAQGSGLFKVTDDQWAELIRLLGALPSETKSRTRQNPAWTRDELILALDLYFRFPPGTISQSHPEVVALSNLLNTLPIHGRRPAGDRFRNPNGVYMKMCNFLAIDPGYAGKGLTSFGREDQRVWEEFSGDKDLLSSLARSIRDGANTVQATWDPDEDEESFPEGRVLYRLHRARERSAKLAKKKKRQVLKQTGCLACEVCGFDFSRQYGELGAGFIECHHTKPLSELDSPADVRLGDLVVLCSNCHRMVHRRRPWLSVADLSALLR